MKWTPELTAELLAAYETKSIEELCEQFGVNKTSIINKLVREGVYKKPEPKTVVTKKHLVRAVYKRTGLELQSLVNVNKQELMDLVDWIDKISDNSWN